MRGLNEYVKIGHRSTINLEHLNRGGSILSDGFEYRLEGKALFCRNIDTGKNFGYCGDMKADDFIMDVLVSGQQK